MIISLECTECSEYTEEHDSAGFHRLSFLNVNLLIYLFGLLLLGVGLGWVGSGVEENCIDVKCRSPFLRIDFFFFLLLMIS